MVELSANAEIVSVRICALKQDCPFTWLNDLIINADRKMALRRQRTARKILNSHWDRKKEETQFHSYTCCFLRFFFPAWRNIFSYIFLQGRTKSQAWSLSSISHKLRRDQEIRKTVCLSHWRGDKNIGWKWDWFCGINLHSYEISKKQ